MRKAICTRKPTGICRRTAKAAGAKSARRSASVVPRPLFRARCRARKSMPPPVRNTPAARQPAPPPAVLLRRARRSAPVIPYPLFRARYSAPVAARGKACRRLYATRPPPGNLPRPLPCFYDAPAGPRPHAAAQQEGPSAETNGPSPFTFHSSDFPPETSGKARRRCKAPPRWHLFYAARERIFQKVFRLRTATYAF